MIWKPKTMIEQRASMEVESRVQLSLSQQPLNIIDVSYSNKSQEVSLKARTSDESTSDPSDDIKLLLNTEEPNKLKVVTTPISFTNNSERDLPKVNSATSFSRTFQKMSNSKKFQNVNIVAVSNPEGSLESPKILHETSMPVKPNKLTTRKPSTARSVTNGTPLKKLESYCTNVGSNNVNTPVTSTPQRNSTPPDFASSLILADIPIMEKDSGSLDTCSEKDRIPSTTTPRRIDKSSRMNSFPTEVSSSSVRPDFPAISHFTTKEQRYQCRSKLFTSPKKITDSTYDIGSREGHRLVKEPRKPPGRSLAEEIIQELNAKCETSSKSSYTSPGSKKFVKKLVLALQRGSVVRLNNKDGDCRICSDTYCKSAGPPSVSTSDKDRNDGSDEKWPKTKTVSNSPFRNFASALGTNRSRGSSKPYVNAEDATVYWIPMKANKMPRTSSLIARNAVTKLSFGNGDQSPKASPVHGVVERPSSSQFHASGWGKTFDRKQSSRQLFRIEETAVFDSGYYNRSGDNFSSSSVYSDDYWFDETEDTRTASEMGYDTEMMQMTKPIHPRALPSYRQRTFVI